MFGAYGGESPGGVFGAYDGGDSPGGVFGAYGGESPGGVFGAYAWSEASKYLGESIESTSKDLILFITELDIELSIVSLMYIYFVLDIGTIKGSSNSYSTKSLFNI